MSQSCVDLRNIADYARIHLMKAHIVHIGVGNTSGNIESADVARPCGARGRELTQAEAEHSSLLFSMFKNHMVGTRALGAKTVEVAMGAILSFFRWTGIPPWDWAPQDFSDFIAYKVTESDIGLGRQATYITYLRSFQNFVLDSRGLSNDIHRKFGVQPQRFINDENAIPIKRKRHERKKAITPLSAKQCQQLIEQFDLEIRDAKLYGSKSYKPLQRDKVMVLLLLMTGVRVDELVHLRLQDFRPDLKRPDFGGYALMTVVLGKGRKSRVVRLYQSTIRDVMDWYLDNVRPQFLRATTPDSTLLFLSERGGPVCTEQVRRMLGRISANAGIAVRVTPHIMRHTYGTQMAAVIGAEALQRQLGHENLTTTLGTYYHQDPEWVGREVELGISNLTNAINAITGGLADEDHD